MQRKRTHPIVRQSPRTKGWSARQEVYSKTLDGPITFYGYGSTQEAAIADLKFHIKNCNT